MKKNSERPEPQRWPAATDATPDALARALLRPLKAPDPSLRKREAKTSADRN